MPRHPLRAAAVGAVALLAGLLTAPSAQADIRIFLDVGGHITGGGRTDVRVTGYGS